MNLTEGQKRLTRELITNTDPHFAADTILRIAAVLAVETNATTGEIGGTSEGEKKKVYLSWEFDSEFLKHEGAEAFGKLKEELAHPSGTIMLDWPGEGEDEMTVRVTDKGDRVQISTDIEAINFDPDEVAQLGEVLSNWSPNEELCGYCNKPGHEPYDCPEKKCRYCGEDHDANEESLLDCQKWPARGHLHERTKTHPHERVAAEAWEKNLRHHPDFVHTIIGRFATIEEEEVAYSIIQWLGTNVGYHFMEGITKQMDALPRCPRCKSVHTFEPDQVCRLCQKNDEMREKLEKKNDLVR